MAIKITIDPVLVFGVLIFLFFVGVFVWAYWDQQHYLNELCREIGFHKGTDAYSNLVTEKVECDKKYICTVTYDQTFDKWGNVDKSVPHLSRCTG